MKYDQLHLCTLTPEQRERTCGYWYTVLSRGMSHTAFRSRAALLLWLGQRNISLTAPLPRKIGEHSVQSLDGHYHRQLFIGDIAAFRAAPGIPTHELENGEYLEAKLTRDPQGIVTVHVPYVQTDGVQKFDYRAMNDFYSGAWNAETPSEDDA